MAEIATIGFAGSAWSIVVELRYRKASVVPLFHPPAQDTDLQEAGRTQSLRSGSRALIGSADENDWCPLQPAKFGQPSIDLGDRNVTRRRDMSERSGELTGAPYVDDCNGVAAVELSFEIANFDPRKRPAQTASRRACDAYAQIHKISEKYPISITLILHPSRGRCGRGFTKPDQCLANIPCRQRNRSFCLGSPSASALYDLGRTISRQSICRPSLHGGRSPDRSLHISRRVFRCR